MDMARQQQGAAAPRGNWMRAPAPPRQGPQQPPRAAGESVVEPPPARASSRQPPPQQPQRPPRIEVDPVARELASDDDETTTVDDAAEDAADETTPPPPRGSPSKSRAPRNDEDRHHDPEADGFTAIDGPRTPCPFRIQVQHGGRGAIASLDDLGLGAATTSWGRATPPPDELAVSPDAASASVAPAPRDEPAAARQTSGRPPSASAGRRAAAGRPRPQSAHPSTYRGAAHSPHASWNAPSASSPHNAPHLGSVLLAPGPREADPPRAVFDGGAPRPGLFAPPPRRFSARPPDRPFLFDANSARERDAAAPLRPAGLAPRPKAVERSSSSPNVVTLLEPTSAPPTAADMAERDRAGSGSGGSGSLIVDDDELLEVASGSSFNGDEDHDEHLDTNLGEEFLSLFAPVGAA